jgi:putative heme iron utilization protein
VADALTKESQAMNKSPLHDLDELIRRLDIQMLTVEQVQRIDGLLSEVGEYGEVHLIVQKGELRYINKVESYKAWKPGDGHKK